MKTVYVDQLTPYTGRFDSIFQVRQADRKEAKNGNAYMSLRLGDRTGEVDAKFWDLPDGFTCAAGDFLKVRATTGTYNDRLQLTVELARSARADVAIEDFIPASKRDRDEMYAGLASWIGTISIKELQEAVWTLTHAHKHELRDAPAARKVHQAYLGGLLEHVLNLCSLVDAVCGIYPDLNRDVLMAGMIVHDIGKIHEYRYQDDIGSTTEGSLLGHIIQGSILWDRYSFGVHPDIRNHVAHIIASHHGQPEWGAAVVPMTREAQMAHLLDMIDSRMAIIDESLASQSVDGRGFTARHFALGTELWNGGAPRTALPADISALA